MPAGVFFAGSKNPVREGKNAKAYKQKEKNREEVKNWLYNGFRQNIKNKSNRSRWSRK